MGSEKGVSKGCGPQHTGAVGGEGLGREKPGVWLPAHGCPVVIGDQITARTLGVRLLQSPVLSIERMTKLCADFICYTINYKMVTKSFPEESHLGAASHVIFLEIIFFFFG